MNNKANIPSLIDMRDTGIGDYLRGTGTLSLATVCSRNAKIVDESRLMIPSNLVNKDRSSDRVAPRVVANEHHPNMEEHLHDIQRRHKKTGSDACRET